MKTSSEREPVEELLRIAGAVREADGMEPLRDYALEVYRGDIVYVQGAPGSGARTLVSLLAGECALEAGRLYLNAQEVPTQNRLVLWQHGLYTIAADKDLVEGMSVAENLEAIRYLPNCLRIYRQEESTAKVAGFLHGQGIDVPADAMVWSLSRSDRVRLSLLKARMHGAQMIVLDATEDYYEGPEAKALCDLIARQNREGVSFVIVSECYCPFAEIATRIQLIDCGRDMKEWPALTPHTEALLRGSLPRRNDRQDKDGRRLFLGICDSAWERQESFLGYLRRLREENPLIWQRLAIDIPDEGTCRRGDTVVIPAGSENMLLDNLRLSDNTILTCSQRVAANRLGVIPLHVQRSMTRRFCQRFCLPSDTRRISELNRVQRKILSIYRYELLRPAAIVLESPYAGMMNSQVEQLRSYLRELADGGIRVICFSKSPDAFTQDCFSVVFVHNGRNAKMSTE